MFVGGAPHGEGTGPYVGYVMGGDEGRGGVHVGWVVPHMEVCLKLFMLVLGMESLLGRELRSWFSIG